MSRSLPTNEHDQEHDQEHDREWEQENQRNFRKLLLSVQASLKQLNLLIAICDHPTYREELIRDYEAQLTAKGITCLRVQLDRHQTSLKQALLALAAEEPALHEDQPVMVTVCGADQMLSVRLDEEQSAREQFFFSLQWTREALRQFQFPIVIWLTEQIVRELTQQAPDFWSWRGGVFQFVRPRRVLTKEEKATQEVQASSEQLKIVSAEQSDVPFPYLHPDQQLRELRQQIVDLEAQDPKSPLLKSLYSSLGKMYEDRLARGLANSHSKEQRLAIQAYKNAITRQTQEDAVEFAKNLNNLAGLYRDIGHYEEAEPLYLQSLTITELELGSAHLDTAVALNNLALLYESMGRYEEAELLYLRSLSIREQQLRDNDPYIATSCNNLAEFYRAMGRYEEAEPLHLRALAIREQQLGANHLRTAVTLNNLALLYDSMGRYEEAEPFYLRSLSIREQQLGVNHPDVATTLNNLALLYRAQGRYEESEPLCIRSLSITEQQLGADHPHTATSLNNLAVLYKFQGRYEEAEPLHLRSLAICEQQLGLDHPDTATSLTNLAELYRSTGRYDEAEPLYVRSLAIREQQLGLDHPDTATSLTNLAELYRLTGRYDEAEPLYVRSLKIDQKVLGDEHPNTKQDWKNFRLLIQQAVREGRSAELSDHPTTQRAIEQLRQASGEMGE